MVGGGRASAVVMVIYNLLCYSRFVPVVVKEETTILCSENTAIFQASIYLYVSLAVSFSRGPPFRKPVYTNGVCVSNLVGFM